MKKVIFSFFSFREVLGLGLKILFHKNKEIERMLSKKMAFSLMSLITIFALALVVPSAMAQDFDTSMDIADADVDIGFADNAQVALMQAVDVRITFGEVVKRGPTVPPVAGDLVAADITGITYNEDGGATGTVTVTNVRIDPVTPNGKNFLVTVPRQTATVRRVLLYIAEGAVGLADPSADAKGSKKASLSIAYVEADEGAPLVYAIRRVSDPLLPIKPATHPTVQVVIRLSEMPAKFTKDHITASNATHGDPAALTPVREDTLGQADLEERLIADWLAANPAPMARMLYDVVDDDDEVTQEGIHSAIVDDPSMALMDALEAYNELADDALADPISDDVLPSTLADPVDVNTNFLSFPVIRPLRTFTLAANADSDASIEVLLSIAALETELGITPAADAQSVEDRLPVVLAHADLDEAIEALIAAVDIGVDRSSAPVRPVLADYVNADNPATAFTNATELFNRLRVQYMLYSAEMALYMAYTDDVDALEAEDTAMVVVHTEMRNAELLDALSEHYQGTAVIRDNPLPATGTDGKLHSYVVTITPKYENKNDVVVRVKTFNDHVLPNPNRYTPPRIDALYREGIDQLTIKVGEDAPKAGTAGFEVVLPKELFIPKDGYLVVADDADGSAIVNPGGAKDAPPVTRKPAAQKYNLHAIALPNLQGFLINGGVIDVVSPLSLTISEVMWGTDASLVDDNSKSQWIELLNSGAGANTADDDAATAADEATRLIFYGPNETPPALNADGTLPAGVKDRIGGLTPASLVGRGQNGRSGVGEEKADLTALVPTLPLISMRRVMDTTTSKPLDGTLATSWIASGDTATGLGVNFDPSVLGRRVGTPGADHLPSSAERAEAIAKEKTDAAEKVKAADTSVSMPENGQIYISEIMFAGGGTLPQWIEISNGSRSEEVNLSDWTITVYNAAADADVSIGASAKFTISDGTMIAPSEQHDPSGDNTPSTILVVTEAGRNNVDGSGQVLNLLKSNEVDLILAGVVKRKYTLLSDMAFMITLAPPEPEATDPPADETKGAKAIRQAAEKKEAAKLKAATDMVGNLGADGAAAWVLPMSEEGGRSSIIRRHVQVSIGAAAPEMGTMMDSWVLASDTSFAQPAHGPTVTYYGAANDVGTPGFRAGGALPVELSHFRPARDKISGAVVITWSTQSELNNAGFFIKRSQQRDGEFKVINATMIAGAGTTSEKQFYTYSDTTAQPNVVYYYQIEDVSLDGNRQTLTRGIRLKGHVSVAGKLTTLWGDLKTSQ